MAPFVNGLNVKLKIYTSVRLFHLRHKECAPLEARRLSAAWITLPLSKKCCACTARSKTFHFLPPQPMRRNALSQGRGALPIPQPFGDSWHLLIIRVFLIIVETVPVEGASRERHVKTSSTVEDQTASVMGKLVRGAA